MLEDIEQAYQDLAAAVAQFNRLWPAYVVEGTCWALPLLAEQRTPDLIQVERLDGEGAINAAIGAFASFKRDIGQAPGTVMRLPGVFMLDRSVLNQVQHINNLKDALANTIKSTQEEMKMVAAARPKLMRQALGGDFNTKQLLRHIQAFDGEPRLIVFTWAGHTTGGERITVDKVRADLRREAESRADREGIDLRSTPEQIEIDSLSKMDPNETLLKHKKVAPHPRAMFYLSESTRYTAMIHANLPAFVLAGAEGSCKIRPLKNFDRNARGKDRPDVKARIEALPGKDLFLPSAKKKAPKQRPLDVPSTYGGTSE